LVAGERAGSDFVGRADRTGENQSWPDVIWDALASKPGTSILRRLVTRHGPWQSLRCERIGRAGRQLEREEVMRKILAALLCCWCSHALAQTAQDLIDNPKNSENVTTFGMGYHLNQYSPLNQINKSNVKRLVPIWTTSLSNDAGEMTQPSIYNGIMYVCMS
jgi:hypothetical protein